MSWTLKSKEDWLAMWNERLDAKKCNPALFKVLFALARYANGHTGECEPSQQALAEDAAMSERYARDLLGELARLGAVELVRAGGGRNNSSVYRLIDDPGGVLEHAATVKARRAVRAQARRDAQARYRQKQKQTQFAAVYERGREVLGAGADALVGGLLKVFDNESDEALEALAGAARDADPRQYIKEMIEQRTL